MSRRKPTLLAALVLTLVACGSSEAGSRWGRAAPLPLARGEVAAAAFGREIAVVGGFLVGGGTSARADAYSPTRNRWRRLPNLPLGLHHPMAAGHAGRLYVLGGYRAGWIPQRGAFVLAGTRWRRLPSLPEARAAAGAAVVDGKLYVVGGVGPGGLARSAFVLDLGNSRRWRTIPGPTPREHLGVASLRGRIYAVAGRTGGFETNLTTFEAYNPRTGRWRGLPPVPQPRGGTGAAALGSSIVSVGGERAAGTIRRVYRYDIGSRRWRRLPDLPTPRHGIGAAALEGRVYVIAGGHRPGLAVSAVNEFLPLP